MFIVDVSELRPSFIEISNVQCVDHCRKSNSVVVYLQNGEV